MVVGGVVQGIGEGGDGMCGEGGASGFGERGVDCSGSQKVCVEESSSKLTTGRFLFEASLILFLCLTKSFFFVGILTSSSLEVSSYGFSPSFSFEISPLLVASSYSPFETTSASSFVAVGTGY